MKRGISRYLGKCSTDRPREKIDVFIYHEEIGVFRSEEKVFAVDNVKKLV